MIEKAVSQLIRTIRIRHHTFMTIPAAPVKHTERRLIAVGAGQKNRRNTKFMHFLQNQRVLLLQRIQVFPLLFRLTQQLQL